jgi:hypothetical protein
MGDSLPLVASDSEDDDREDVATDVVSSFALDL